MCSKLFLFLIANLLFLFFCLDASIVQIDLSITYQQFKQLFHKPAHPPNQQLQRQIIFYQNMQILKNKLKGGCEACAVTKFFDQSTFKFKTRMGLLKQNLKSDSIHYGLYKSVNSNGNTHLTLANAPSKKNWADEGKVTSIKDQGDCGACWSFATAAAIQSSLILKGQAFNSFFYQPDLSEQFLLTCASVGTCQGGYLEEAIDLAYQQGIPYQTQEPYLGQKGDQTNCRNNENFKLLSKGQARFSYYNIQDDKIISLLQQGPLIITVSADDWQFYGGGIFSCKLTALVNHAVLLVGYDQNKWILKNQWGEDWGQKGYIYVTKNRLRNCRIGSAVHRLSNHFLFFYLPLVFAFFVSILI